MSREAPPAGAQSRADERESLLVVRNLLVALGVFVVGLLVAVSTRGDDAEPGSAPEPNPEGRNVDEFVRDAERELEGLDGVHSAAVSFAEYLDADAADALIEVEVRQWLVAAPGGEAVSVADVEAWREDEADRARKEAAALEQIIPTAGDPEFVRQYERDRERQIRVADALDGNEPVVFGALIAAPAGVLRQLAGDQAIRLVDADTERGLRPEETVVVGEPKARP